MPRAARLDISGVLQHVIVRGIEGRDIFLDDQDRSLFLTRLSSLLRETSTRCFAWSLLPNHFHLLLVPTAAPLSHLMRSLLTGYAVGFNRKYRRAGHLFQNRYKSIVCEEEPYLLELVRYIHLNPLRAGLIANLEDLDRYPWSGHAVLMGHRSLEGQETRSILERFGKTLLRAREHYRQFVADGVGAGKREELIGGGRKRSQAAKGGDFASESFDERILGSGSFVDQLRQDPVVRGRLRTIPSLSELIERICIVFDLEPATLKRPSKARIPAQARGLFCYIAVREFGYKGKEVGRELNLGPAGVSIAIRRGERAIKDAPWLKERVTGDK